MTALIQDVRFWSSQRETNFSEVPNLSLLGNELGLQVWLPLNELTGTPIEQARGRIMQMQANWASTNESHALDFASNASGENVILTAAGFGAITPGLSRDRPSSSGSSRTEPTKASWASMELLTPIWT